MIVMQIKEDFSKTHIYQKTQTSLNEFICVKYPIYYDFDYHAHSYNWHFKLI